jgi:cell division protein FtsW
VPLLLVTITLVVFGIIMVYSASWDISFFISETNSPTFMLTRQLGWLGVGLVAMFFLAWMDYRLWQRFALWGMLVAVVALLGVLVFGDAEGGITRTFYGGSYQPSELAKLMIVVYLAVWLYSKRDFLSDVNFGLVPLAAILGIVGGLIFSQPDLSAAATIIILGGIMFFLAGGDLRQILILLAFTVLFGLLVVKVNPTGSERIASFLAGLKDPLQSSDHVQRSLSAFAKGGWFGVGIGRSTTKLTSLPVPHTDSVFAVIGEELGFFGAFAVAALYGALLWRGLVIARKAPDGLGSLLAAGLTTWITMEAFMNMLALIGLMPFAGNALPLFSVGGSSLVFTLAGIGIVLNISRLSEQEQFEAERRTIGALIDLRWRDWRRRLSRSRGTRNPKR